jgi:hypothetical protein
LTGLSDKLATLTFSCAPLRLEHRGWSPATGAWEPRRFRPNILIDLEGEGSIKDGWSDGRSGLEAPSCFGPLLRRAQRLVAIADDVKENPILLDYVAGCVLTTPRKAKRPPT